MRCIVYKFLLGPGFLLRKLETNNAFIQSIVVSCQISQFAISNETLEMKNGVIQKKNNSSRIPRGNGIIGEDSSRKKNASSCNL